MPTLPPSESSLLVRTDFTDDAAWSALRTAVTTESDDGFLPDLEVVDDRAWDGASVEDVRDAALATGVDSVVLFVADGPALAGELPVLVVDLHEDPPPPFRCVARKLWSVENNLGLANMDWHEFVDASDEDGVYRGMG